MHIESEDIFSKWLIAELTPIADADPQALAKYVLALLKKQDKSSNELKEFVHEQLSVFLGDNTTPFVDKIFSALHSKSYLTTTVEEDVTESAPPPPPSVETKRSRKEEAPVSKPSKPLELPSTSSPPPGIHKSSSKTERPVRKRISPPPSDNKDREKEKSSRDKVDRRRSRSPRDRRNRQTTSSRGGRASSSDRDRYNRRRSRSRSYSESRSRSPPTYKSRSRRRCKDFEERGYCIRGEQCPYYHGPDPVVVDENALSSMVPIPSAPPNFSFSLPPPGYNPLNPPPPGVVVSAGEYNPETPALNVTYSVPPPPLPGQWQQPPPQAAPYIPQPISNFSQPPPGTGAVTQAPPPAATSFRGGMRGRGSARGGRGGMGRGGYGGPINRDNCTLQVAKVPIELNNIAKLNEHFGTFGTVENIQVRYNGDQEAALVTFASKFDAQKAYKSPAPVLNNRFIKVFWHKPELEGGENAAGKPSSPPSPPKPAEKPKIATVKESKFVNADIQNYRKQILEAKQRLATEKAQLTHLVGLQNQQNILMEKWMTRQKDLLVKARTHTEEAERKNATKLVKTLHKKIKTLKEEIDGVLMQISEKSMLVDEVNAQIENIKNPMKMEDAAGRKRKADGDLDDDLQSKMSSVVIIKGVKEELVTDLMAHMEKFGEVFDTSVKVDDGLATAVFPFKKYSDAMKVMADGKMLNGVALDMELKTEKIDEIPSTDTNMSADQLLAAIPSGLESDEDEDILNE